MKKIHFFRSRFIAALLALACELGLLPAVAFAADTPNTIKMIDCDLNGVTYVSPTMGTCHLHLMNYDFKGKSTVGFCGEHGKGIGKTLTGHTWNDPKPITDPTVTTMMAYFYAHSTGKFTDQAKAIGEDKLWASDYVWTMNAWVQTIVWRYKAGLLSDPVIACAEELLCVYNNLEHTSYTSIDDKMDGKSFRDRAKYILDLGAQGVWGDCAVYEYTYAGPGTSYFPPSNVQAIVIGELTVTHEQYKLIIKKVDSTNPNKGLAGARFMVTNENGSYSKEFVTGQDGTVTVPNLEAGVWAVTELEAPEGYEIDNAGPQYVTLPNGTDKTVTVTFSDTPIISSEGSIRKVDTDNPTKGLAGAVIKITGVDNDFTGTYVTGPGGCLTDVPWDSMPIGSFTAEEVTPPEGYTKSPDISKTKQTFVWDGKSDVSLVFENDAKVKVKLIKLDDSGDPLPGAVFNILKDGQIIGTEATKADGSITVTDVTEGMYAFVEVSAPKPFACLTEPVIAHVDQATVNGGGTVTVTAVDKRLPLLTLSKTDAEDQKPIPNTVLTVKALDGTYQDDWKTGPDGTVSLRVNPGTYEITEKSVPLPYYLPDKDADRTQTITLSPGDEKNLVFRNHKTPELTIFKEDSVAGAPIEGAKFHVTLTSNGEAADAPGSIDYGYLFTDASGQIKVHEQGKKLYPGEYTITEVAPAPGFQMKEPTTQRVIIHGGESKSVTFQNEPLNGIIVEKYDSVTHEALPGCTFQLRFLGGTSGTGGTVIGTKVTGKNGTAIWTGLTAGTYVVEEISPADGYSIINSSETVYLADSGEQSVVTVSFDNSPDGILLVRKVCSVNPSITLQDAEFKITYADGTLIGDSNGIYRTDENGEIRIPSLKPGKSVVVTETRAPAGFIIDTQSQTVQIKEGRTVTLTFKNQPKGAIIIQKRDSLTGQPLPDAEFRVAIAAGCEVGLDGVIGSSTLTQNGIFTTDAQGEIKITNLAPGAYVLSEIKAPTGYVIDRASTNVVIGQGGDTQTVVVTNSKAGTLVIDKRDALTGKPLKGVTFKVTTSTGEYVPDASGHISSNGLYFTDKDGKITINGVVGTLVVTETATIPGYTIDPATQTQTVKVNPQDTQTLTFYNAPKQTLTIQKYVDGTTDPIQGVTFLVTDSSGAVVGPNNGEYITDRNGRIVLTDLVPGTTITAKEIKTASGYVLDTTPQSILIKSGEAQALTFFNKAEGGLELIKVSESDKSKRIPGVTFEIRKMDGGLIDTVTTDSNGRVHIDLDAGDYYAVETEAAQGFKLDSTPHYFTVADGKTTTLTVTNKAFSGILIHKTDSVTGKGIYGVTFFLYDASNTPIGQYTSDNSGYVYIDNLTVSGRYYLRELENKGYVPDTQMKTVYVTAGKTTLVEWKNIPITAQIQILKKSADYNPTNGLPAGTPLEGAIFEIYDKAGNLVDTIRSDSRGLAVSRPLPLSRYTIREVKAPDNYGVNDTVLNAYLEHKGQILTFEVTNKSLTTGVAITKTGPKEVMGGQPVRYMFSGIANTSNVRLDSFYWRDTLPAEVILDKVVTGTYNCPGNYKIVYRINGGEYQTLADNLSTQKNYTLAASPVALGLASNERVTEIMFVFGQAPAGFAQVEKPYIYCNVRPGLPAGSFVNKADVGGVYNGEWIQAVSRWVTAIYGKPTTLPRTGY